MYTIRLANPIGLCCSSRRRNVVMLVVVVVVTIAVHIGRRIANRRQCGCCCRRGGRVRVRVGDGADGGGDGRILPSPAIQ